MGKKAIFAEKRAQINSLIEEGHTDRQITSRLGVSKTAVHQAMVTFQKYDIYANCKRSRRLLKTNKTCFPQIVRLFQYKEKLHLGFQNKGYHCKILGCYFDTQKRLKKTLVQYNVKVHSTVILVY